MLIQDFVHRIEIALGSRYMRLVLVLLAVGLVGIAYDFRQYKNMAAPEAMDSAQLARNIAEGKGYTTLFVRPLSVFLLKKVDARSGGGTGSAGTVRDSARVRGPHPDLENPPVYPFVLAGLMKAVPFHFSSTNNANFFNPGGIHFQRYQPDFVITLFNQVLFLALIVVVFLWARRLMDNYVAWTSVTVLLFSDLLWRFSVSGLSTMLMLLLFMAVVWCLTVLESEAREPRWGPNVLLALSVMAGFLVGVGTLTRYAFGWVIIPVVIFLIFFSGNRRVIHCIAAFVAFAVVVAPWIGRNYKVSGEPFGTATFAFVENEAFFPRDRLERSLEPSFSEINGIIPFRTKLVVGMRDIVDNQLPELGGKWLTAFFIAGLMIGFQNPALRRFRYFLLINVPVLLVVQAMGRTHLSDINAGVNSENILVLLLPLAMVYGVAFFYALLDQIEFPVPVLRFMVIALFIVVVRLPMIFAIFGPKENPVSYPPYYPPQIETAADFIKEDEWMMSDMPWAVAWYGHRKCMWLTLNAQPDRNDRNARENFYTVYDEIRPVNELYLTPITIDSKFLSDWYKAGNLSWGSFVLDTLLRKEVPPTFPVYQMPPGYSPDAILLQDYKRWHD